MLPEHGEDERPVHQRVRLLRLDDHRWFAYGRVNDFIRSSDHTLWAHLIDGWLISARSGQRLAYQVGNIFYDATTRQALYSYETA